MDGSRILPKSAQLNWYLFDHTEPVFKAFFQRLSGRTGDRNGVTSIMQNPIISSQRRTVDARTDGGLNFSRHREDIPGYLGRFILAEEGVPEGYYPSVIIASKNLEKISIDNLSVNELCAAISEKDSYSGRFALYQTLGEDLAPCAFGRVSYTGAHRGTLAAIACGQADIGRQIA